MNSLRTRSDVQAPKPGPRRSTPAPQGKRGGAPNPGRQTFGNTRATARNADAVDPSQRSKAAEPRRNVTPAARRLLIVGAVVVVGLLFGAMALEAHLVASQRQLDGIETGNERLRGEIDSLREQVDGVEASTRVLDAGLEETQGHNGFVVVPGEGTSTAAADNQTQVIEIGPGAAEADAVDARSSAADDKAQATSTAVAGDTVEDGSDEQSRPDQKVSAKDSAASTSADEVEIIEIPNGTKATR